MTEIRSASQTQMSTTLTSDHGTAGVSAPLIAVSLQPHPADSEFHPATLDSATVRWSIGPGTSWPVQQGHYWIVLRFQDSGYPVEVPVGEIDVDSSAVVTIEDLARRLNLDPTDSTVRATLSDAIEDATADIEAYLGRPITPQVYTEISAPDWDGQWLLSQQPLVRVLSVEAVSTSDGTSVHFGTTSKVTYLAGLDTANDPALAPIRRYLKAAVMNAPDVVTLWRQANPPATRVLTSVSVEGQTVGYSLASLGGGGAAAADSPGALPSIKSISRWKLRGRRVFQRPGIAPDPLDALDWPGRRWHHR
jgi:hypothetical protein